MAENEITMNLGAVTAYGIAKKHGFTGTEQEWLDSLHGTHANLLDNWYFGNPVNQRGVTSGETVYQTYGVDRWKWNYGSTRGRFEVVADGLKLIPAANDAIILMQYFEHPEELDGKTLTVSVLFANGDLSHGTFTRSSGTNQGVYENNLVRVTFATSNALWIRVKTENTVRAVKMEYGSVSTLANDSAPDYATELLKCQRYLHAYGSASARPSNALDCVPHMRTTPSQTTVIDADGVTRYLNVAEL